MMKKNLQKLLVFIDFSNHKTSKDGENNISTDENTRVHTAESNVQQNLNHVPAVTKSIDSASKLITQKTPFGLNRYLLLIIHVLYTFTTGRIYFGWPNLSNILFRAGAYSWLCEGKVLILDDKRSVCAEQDSAIQLLFTIVCATAFCCSLLNGYLLDWKGPKLTAVWGQILNATSWIVLAFSGEDCKSYIPAMILMGLGADAGFLPATNICNIFPKNEKIVIALISAAMSASFAIPTILDSTWRNFPNLGFKNLCFWYAGFGPCLAGIIAALCFPSKIYVSELELEKPNNYLSKDVNFNDTSLNLNDEISSVSSEINENDSALSNNSAQKFEKISSNKRNIIKQSSSVNFNNKYKSLARLSLRQQLCSKHFWAIYIYWPLNAIFYSYYLTSAENLFGKDVNDALGIMGPLSLVPSIILGKVADRFGVMYLITFIICCAFFMYLFASIHQLWSFYTSAVFSMLYVSCFSGQLYSYVNDTFESIHFGKIVGLVCATGGLLSLLRGPIHIHLTMHIFNGNFTYTCIFMLFIVLLCCFIVVFLFFLKRRQPKVYLSPITSVV